MEAVTDMYTQFRWFWVYMEFVSGICRGVCVCVGGVIRECFVWDGCLFAHGDTPPVYKVVLLVL